MGREILTLQLGHKANYVATHFWNSQEANFDYGEGNEEPIIENDVHFRAGIGEGGVETYTPRTLIYDLKGGFGSLRKYNELYKACESEASPAWEGSVQTYSEPVVPVSAYQAALDSGKEEDILTSDKVRWWSDFNRVYYHPRSAIQLNQYQLDISPFESFTQGRELFQTINKDEDILDRDVRPFAEECDSLQGFQVLMESDSAWAGFGAEYLDAIRNEYPKSSLWTWGIESTIVNATRKLTFAQTMSSVYENTSLYIPLVQPLHIPSAISVDPSSYWHTSALYSLLYDSISLPTRTRTDYPFAMDMHEFTTRVNVHGQRKIATPSVTILDSPGTGNLMSLGWPEILGERAIMAIVLRGSLSNMDIDELTRDLSQGSIVTERILHPQPFPLPTSFPKVFTHSPGISSVNTFSSLSSNPSTITSHLKDLGNDAKQLASLEDREQLVNTLGEISSYFEDDVDWE